jgi:hypothetical protein
MLSSHLKENTRRLNYEAPSVNAVMQFMREVSTSRENDTKSVYISMNLIRALPGNSSVNTVQHATIDEAVFSMSSAPRPMLQSDT